MENTEFTIEQWYASKQDMVPWNLDPEIQAKLEKMSDEMLELCVKHGVPCVMSFVVEANPDVYDLRSSFNLMNMAATPPEYLASYRIVMDSLEEGLPSVLSMFTNL